MMGGNVVRTGEFSVEVPGFSGPFRVLAELLMDKKVDVCDVPVARVTEGFLARSKEAEGWSLDEATWFLAICAALLEMKVGRLLPRHTEPDEEDLLGASPDLAYARSLELAAFRHIARWLVERFEEGARYHAREASVPEEYKDLYPDVMERVTPEALAQAAASLLRPQPALDLSHVTPIRFTLADAVESVVGQLGERKEARFRELVADCTEAIEVVVRFLALLELYKDGRVDLRQAETFGEIEVRWEG